MSIMRGCLTAFVVVAAIGAVGSCFGGGSDDKVKSVSETTKVESSTEMETTEKETEKEIEKEKTKFEINEIAEYKNVKYILIGYEESSGNDWGSPEDGKIFVYPEIEIFNESDEEIHISSMVSFECYVDGYKTDFSSEAFMAISKTDGKQQLDGGVASGKKLKGVLGIEAEIDWKEIEIYFKDNMFKGSNFSFIITK